MPRRDAAAAAALLVALVGALSSCTAVEEQSAAGAVPAAHVEAVDGSRSRLLLTPRAAERLGLQTAPVRAVSAAGRSGPVRLAVPYSAVVFTADGRPWSYVAASGHSYLRAPLALDSVDGDVALLLDGPAVGSRVVTDGAAELYGTEFDVGH